MKPVTEFRNAKHMRGLLNRLEKEIHEPLTIMEVCGGQAHSIMRYGIDRLLPEGMTLVHGPGCPVCVTPEEIIDHALAIARQPDVIFCSYGDMLRVPGRQGNLLQAKAEGADVRVLYTPLDLLALAESNPAKKLVFLAIGFETTAPAHAMVLAKARQKNIRNLYFLVAHRLVPPVMRHILAQRECGINGFLAAGHVCAVTGYTQYHQLARDYHVPIAVTGFEPLDILLGLLACATLHRKREAAVINPYSRAVRELGNSHAQAAMDEVFVTADVSWRGLGMIPGSGLRLAEAYRDFDASERFDWAGEARADEEPCQAGKILLGLIKPPDCPHFGKLCQPTHPLGAPMVSSEGACAAYHMMRQSSSSVEGL
jgi:hydrogenase expression/formation protein HypD